MSGEGPLPQAAHGVRIRRSRERGFEDFGWADSRLTFAFGVYHDPDWQRFGPLRMLVENHVQPRAAFPAHSHRDVEVVTYVVSGSLAYGDSAGARGELAAGEMQVASAGSEGISHTLENPSDEPEHDLQMWLVPAVPGTGYASRQLGFTAEERRSRLRLYASPDGRAGSITIYSGACIYAGLFTEGDRVRHTVEPGRAAWVQVVSGWVRTGGVELAEGDGAGITGAGVVELDFLAPTELLLLDLEMEESFLGD